MLRTRSSKEFYLAFLASLRYVFSIMNENEISQKVVTAAIEVHRTLGGPGLLESVY